MLENNNSNKYRMRLNIRWLRIYV